MEAHGSPTFKFALHVCGTCADRAEFEGEGLGSVLDDRSGGEERLLNCRGLGVNESADS